MNISVVIPVYNRGYIINRAVESVLTQSYPAVEIIVVDDGSTDNTQQILKNYKNRIKVITQENKGVSSARNAGIKMASADWIALLDSDDEWLSHKLANHVEYYRENNILEIFQCEELWVRNGVRVNPKNKHRKYGGTIFKQCLPLCIVSPSAVIFKKSLWQEMNGFDESFSVCEDYDLWLRIAAKYPIGLDARPGIIKYGGHKDQLSRAYPVIDEFRIKALEKQINENSLPDKLKMLAVMEAIRKTKIIIKGAEKRSRDTLQWQKKLLLYESFKSALESSTIAKEKK